MSKIIALIGEKLAGKDTAAEYLVSKYGAYHVRYSHILDEILNILDLPVTRRNENDLGYKLREAFGEDILTQALNKRIHESDRDLIVTNGMRFPAELENAQKLGATIIYITAPEALRFQRLQQRAEKADDVQTMELFRQQAQEVYETNIPELAKHAHYKIDNTGDETSFHAQIDEIMQKVQHS